MSLKSTVFHKPVWEKYLFCDVYWENSSGQSENSKDMTENNQIMCIIPEKSLKSFIPCKDDYICLGDVDEHGSKGFPLWFRKSSAY